MIPSCPGRSAILAAVVALQLAPVGSFAASPGSPATPRLPEARKARPSIQAQTRVDPRYMALIERYQQRDLQAIADLLAWKDEEVRKAADAMTRLAVRGEAASADEVPARVKAAAAMLHTDAGLVDILERGNPDSVHLRIAHAWMLETQRSPLGTADSALKDFTLRDWLLAVVQPFVLRMEYEPARSLLGARGPGGPYRALVDGKDRDLLLAAGWLEESAGLYGTRVLAGEAATTTVSSEVDSTAFMTRRQRAAREEVRAHEARQRAERLYRRALQLDPTCYEAELRLGRVLFDEGQSVEAALHFQRVQGHSTEPRHQYLSALFLGGVREKDGQLDAAADLYLKALTVDPRSQAARVALAAVLDLAGHADRTRDEVAALATRRMPDRSYTDPWSAYVLGQPATDRLSALRRLVVGR